MDLSIYENDFATYRDKEEARLRREAEQLEKRKLERLQEKYDEYLQGIFDEYCATVGEDDLETRRVQLQKDLGLEDPNKNGLVRIQLRNALKKQILSEIDVLCFKEWAEKSVGL